MLLGGFAPDREDMENHRRQFDEESNFTFTSDQTLVNDSNYLPSGPPPYDLHGTFSASAGSAPRQEIKAPSLRNIYPTTIRLHEGPIDPSLTVTSAAPQEVFEDITQVLLSMGLEIRKEEDYKYYCIRPKRSYPTATATVSSGGLVAFFARLFGLSRQTPAVSQTPKYHSKALPPLYGDSSTDAGREVRFSVELARVHRSLEDTFSVDIRRLKGDLRSYKFLYDTFREWANLIQ